MNEKLNVRLGNPVVMFFWSFAMLLTGTFIGEHWHLTWVHSAMIAAAAGAFTMLHELVCCFVWCSLSALVDRAAHGGTQGRALTITTLSLIGVAAGQVRCCCPGFPPSRM